MKCVILAGGLGTRFWPYSRSSRPKQLLKIIGDRSMLQMTVDRLKKIKSITDIYIITRKELYNNIIKEIEGVESKNVIVEPSGKNTAPAIGMMAAYFALKNPDDIMGVFPADHLIVGHRKFEKALSTANYLAKKDEFLVTIGIKPNYPSTAYGYIQYDGKISMGSINAYQVKTFAEKPHEKLAERFISSGDFLWNAGMFFWKVKTFLNGLKIHMPDLTESLNKIALRLSSDNSFEDIWEFIESESIDYGLLEKAKNIYVVPGDFQWNDIGSWEALYDVLSKNKDSNIIQGYGKILEGKNNLIYSADKYTAIIGLDNIVVVNTNDATLILNKNKANDVKHLVKFLKENDQNNLT